MFALPHRNPASPRGRCKARGPCQTLADAAEPEIVAEVLDGQWQDAARQSFKKTTRFSLADLPCRPVKLTLRTAPRFYVTLRIPAQKR